MNDNSNPRLTSPTPDWGGGTVTPPRSPVHKKRRVLPAKPDHASGPTVGTTFRVRGRRGSLKFVTEMPFDVLLEIFSHLEPLDLLNLSRANKALRATLLDRIGAHGVWKSAFRNADPQPPPCPSELNLVRYTNILYGRHCYFCGSIHGTEVLLRAWLRHCKNCVLTEFCRLQEDPEFRTLRSITPVWRDKKNPHVTYLLKSEYAIKRQELEQLRSDKEAYDKYVTEQNRLMLARDKYSYPLLIWESDKKKSKSRGVTERRIARRDTIKGKLNELGYAAEIDGLGSYAFGSLPGVKGVKPLTDKAWEALKPELIAVMDEVRLDKQYKDRCNAINTRIWLFRPFFEYFASQRFEEPMPKLPELATMEPFRSLIFSTPFDKKLTQQDFFRLLDHLPELVASWKNSANAVLLDLFPSQIKKSKHGKAKAPDESVLERATTIFRCKWCSEPITYPRVLVHSCLITPHESSIDDNGDCDDGDSFTEDFNLSTLASGCIWNKSHDQVTFDEGVSEFARDVILASGQDPTTVTPARMDELDCRVECMRCRRNTAQGRLCMTWRSAIMHQIEKHSEDDTKPNAILWEKLTDADAIHAKCKEKKFKKQWKNTAIPKCVECDQLTLKNDQVHFSIWRGGPAGANSDVSCERGHDMSKGTYLDLDMPFHRPPYALRI